MSDTPRCEPPEELRGREWHWVTDDDCEPVMRKWGGKYNGWLSLDMPSSPTLAHTTGWRYIAPVATPAEVDALRAERDELLASRQKFEMMCNEVADKAIAEVAGLRTANTAYRVKLLGIKAEVARLQQFLSSIAAQRTVDEMTKDDYRYADFEGAYDGLIQSARAALSQPEAKE
jgi:hypothetical protein